VEHLLFCLFPSFKERVIFPFETSVWIAFQSVTIVIAAPYSFWECKGSNFFLFSKLQAKKIYFLFDSLSKFGRFRLKRAAKVRWLFSAFQEIQKINLEACERS